MAITIVTMIGDNYGSALQSYALQQALKDCGVHVRTVQLLPRSRIIRFLRSYVIAGSAQEFSRKIWKLRSDIANRSKRKKVMDFFSRGIELKQYKSMAEIRREEAATTTFVAGSDQIWNPAFQPSELYYLQFTPEEGVHRYSYAVSLAVEKLSPTEETYYRSAVQGKFDCVSVREATGANLLRQILPGTTVREDVDPVLLWQPNDGWEALASDRFAEKKYILLYMLRPMEEMVKYAVQAGREMGLPIIYLGDYRFLSRGLTFVGDAGVEDFLSAVEHAELVITNSFHATLFSVMLKKPFYTVAVTRTGSRVTDFLHAVGLEDRIVSNFADSVRPYEADYDCALSKIEHLAAESRAYIRRIAQIERNG